MMTQKKIELIKSSWGLVAAIDPVIVGELFYNRLFDTAPEVKPMFRNTIPEQSKKLLAMLAYIIHKLDRIEEIKDEVVKLAVRHVHYGVKDEHYAVVGATLLLTLEKGLGENWNEDVKEAWADCYNMLSSAMMQAASTVKKKAA